MTAAQRIRSWFKGRAPFAAKRRAVIFLNAMPPERRLFAKVRVRSGMVELRWGYPSWFSKTVHMLIDEYSMHFWIFQGDRSGSLYQLNGTPEKAAQYMAGLLTKCQL